MNGSLVRERVLTVLDLLLVNDPSPGVRAVLRAADPGPYRDAVRDALAAGDRPGVAALAGRPDALDQPVWFAAALGDNVAVPADRRRAVLENALRTRAGDPILLTTLGHSYPRGWPEVAGERARWFQAALAAQPGHPSTLVSLGNALLDQGDPVRAIAECREAIRPAPEFALAHSNLGMALWQKGDRDGAYAEYREAIRLDPELADGHFNLAVALWLHKGDPDGAVVEFREALRLDPKDAFAHLNLGAILCNLKRDHDGAIACFEAAIRLAPKFALAHANLGSARRRKGDVAGAIAAYREATRLDPKYAKTHNNLAWLLAAGPDGLRDGKQAVEHATRGCELTGWKDAAFLEVLATAHAEAGDFDKAVEYQKKALSFPEYGKQVGKAGQERLQLYARKKPYRDPALATVKD